MPAPSPAYKKKVSKLAPLNVALVNKVKGIIGWLLFISMAIKMARNIIPAANEPSTCILFSPTAGIRKKPNVSNAKPKAIVPAPQKSSD